MTIKKCLGVWGTGSPLQLKSILTYKMSKLSRQSTSVGGSKKPFKKNRFKGRKSKPKPKSFAQIANKMKITKCHSVLGINNVMPFGTSSNGLTTNSHWYFEPLCNLQRFYTGSGSTNVQAYADDINHRESSRIYHKNSTIQLDIVPNTNNITPFAYRVAMGYYKGTRVDGSQDLRVPDMVTFFPTMRTPLKGGHSGNQESGRFYWTYVSKVTTVTPKQVYDRNGSDDAVGGESMSAVWVPHTRNYRFKANRIRSFAGDSGDTLEGWQPIFAVQCMPLPGNPAFTHPNVITDIEGNLGSTPCPMLQLDIKTYFQDIH